MDLDISFSLVSSLTPRSQSRKIPLGNNKKLLSKSLKIKKNQNVPSKHRKFSQKKLNDEKENILPEQQLMNKTESFNSDKDCVYYSVKCSPNFPIDMANVAVRKKGPVRNKTKGSQVRKAHNIRSVSSNEDIEDRTFSNKELFYNALIQCDTLHNAQSEILSDCPESYEDLIKDLHPVKKCVEGMSSQINKSPSDSPDVVYSSAGEVETVPVACRDSFYQDVNKVVLEATRNSPRLSGISEISLSSAYDSDSFGKTRRRCVKVIPETSDSDQSFKNNLHDENKSRLKTAVIRKSKKKSTFNNNSNENENRLDLMLRDGTLNVNSSIEANSTNSINKIRSHKEPNEQLNSTSYCKFELKCSIKNEDNLTVNNKLSDTEVLDVNCTKRDIQKLSLSPKFKEMNIKEIHSTSIVSANNTKLKNKEVNFHNLNFQSGNDHFSNSLTTNSVDNNIKYKSQTKKSKHLKGRKSSKTLLVPPTEVIPKFEHINNWLKGTNKTSITVYSNSSLDDSNGMINTTKSSKTRISLSPRIKRKLKIAQSSLSEEQKLFNEIHGNDTTKRLSDDLVDCVSLTSSRESLGASEKVLENLYGTVWQKDAVLPQSEPRRTRKKYSSRKKTSQTEKLSDDLVDCVSITSSEESLEASEKVLEKLYGTVWQKDAVLSQSEPRRTRKKYSPRNKTLQTERKKHRTSIYEVFSSSSSEDRFEEFLENVHRGKIKSSKSNGKFSTPEFINDDSDSDTSLVFYQQVVSSAVKDEVDKFQYKDTEGINGALKTNRRRLSFGSSKDDHSKNSKSNYDIAVEGKKDPTKKNKTKSRKQDTKKKDQVDDEKQDLDLNLFTLVTPLKVKSKKTANDRVFDEDNKAIELPKSVGKPYPPNSLSKYDSTENKSQTKGDFKVPERLISLQTPTKSIKKSVPSSPALSFLSSLSDMTGGLPCHPDALIYKKDFKKKREELTKKLFCLYNKEIFENKLPADMLIEWNTRMRSTSGYCYNKRLYSRNQVFRTSRIVLSTKILDRADRLRDTLIHELCHAATWILDATADGHGPLWRAWADKANRRFPELPVIKRCHDYAISTKFTYKCMSCGYCIGRHSKSIDIQQKRCGYCLGKLEMFVTAKMSTTGSDSVKTQRNPSGFALFVKENYGNVKKENKLPHGQIMKLLSKKFAEVKISKQDEIEPVIIL